MPKVIKIPPSSLSIPVNQRQWQKNFMWVDGGERVKAFDNFIRQHGQDIIINKIITCPCCLRNDTGQPDPSCIFCKGSGRKYDKNDVNTRAVIMGLNKETETNLSTGITLDIGTVQITFYASIRVTLWDKIIGLNNNITMQDVINSYETDVELQTEILEIEQAYIYVSSTEQRDITKTIKINTDKKRNIIINKKYLRTPISIRYKARPYFYVMRMLNEYRGVNIKLALPAEEWVDMPFSVIAQRGDLIK